MLILSNDSEYRSGLPLLATAMFEYKGYMISFSTGCRNNNPPPVLQIRNITITDPQGNESTHPFTVEQAIEYINSIT